jgi:hypothetical protein
MWSKSTLQFSLETSDEPEPNIDIPIAQFEPTERRSIIADTIESQALSNIPKIQTQSDISPLLDSMQLQIGSDRGKFNDNESSPSNESPCETVSARMQSLDNHDNLDTLKHLVN